MLNGYALFKGTHPSCQRLDDSSFTCTLDKPPTEITFYGQDGQRLPNAYLGIKAETVNSSRRVDSGCVATNSDGRAWHVISARKRSGRGSSGGTSSAPTFLSRRPASNPIALIAKPRPNRQLQEEWGR
jgi:hypothetical protein